MTIVTCTGGNIASSWAVLQCMGQDGYMDVAKKLMEVATRMKEGIQSTEVFISIISIMYNACSIIMP